MTPEQEQQLRNLLASYGRGRYAKAGDASEDDIVSFVKHIIRLQTPGEVKT